MVKNKSFQLIIIALVTFLAYSNIFPNSYLGDDRAFFVSWQLTHDIRNIPRLFTEKTNPPGLPLDYHPIRSAVLILAHQFFGENLLGYHALAILVHLASTILVYFIAKQLTSKVKKMGLHLRGGELVSSIKYQVSSIKYQAKNP